MRFEKNEPGLLKRFLASVAIWAEMFVLFWLDDLVSDTSQIGDILNFKIPHLLNLYYY